MKKFMVGIGAFGLIGFLAVTPPSVADDDDASWEDDDDNIIDEEDDSSEDDDPLYTNMPYSATTSEIVTLTDPDAVGFPDRPVPVLVRTPVGATEVLPVILVSHGGGMVGSTNPAGTLPTWSEFLALAGYKVISIAHWPRTPAQRAALCATLNLPPGRPCGGTLAVDRPNDVHVVLDWVDDQVAGPWAGEVDATHIAHVGWSAGSAEGLMTIGMKRAFNGIDEVSNPDDRIDAVVALSPVPPDRPPVSFGPTAFDDIVKPNMVVTGSRDQERGDRRIVFSQQPPNDQTYEIFLDSLGTVHGLFSNNRVPCEADGATPQTCEDLITWMASGVLAFVDHNLKGITEAKDFLEDEELEVISGGVVQVANNDD